MTAEKPDTTVQSVEEPQKELEPAFGWTEYAERINGRIAMIGFVGLLLLEFFTHQDLLTWLGLR